jgi:hypothetical protein
VAFLRRIALLLIACAGSVLPFVHALPSIVNAPDSPLKVDFQLVFGYRPPSWMTDDDDQQSATNQEQFIDLIARPPAFSLTRRQVQARTHALLTPPVRKIFFP